MRHAIGVPLYLLASGHLIAFQTYLHSLGHWAWLVAIGLLIAGVVLPIPVILIMVADGLVFGARDGMIVSMVGSLLGAILAYGFGSWCRRRLGGQACEQTQSARPYVTWGVIIGRWLPGVPGDPMSYTAGLAGMPFRFFMVMTTLALIPATAGASYLGTQVTTDVPQTEWTAGILLVVIGWLCWRLCRRTTSQSACTGL